jgi:hypothetical protein
MGVMSPYESVSSAGVLVKQGALLVYEALSY